MKKKPRFLKYCPYPSEIKNQKISVVKPSFIKKILQRRHLRKAGVFIVATAFFMVFLFVAQLSVMRQYTRPFEISNGGAMRSVDPDVQLRVSNSIVMRDGRYEGTYIEISIFLDFGWSSVYSSYWFEIDNETVQEGVDPKNHTGPCVVSYAYKFQDDGVEHFYNAGITTTFMSADGEIKEQTHYDVRELPSLSYTWSWWINDLMEKLFALGWALFYVEFLKMSFYLSNEKEN